MATTVPGRGNKGTLRHTTLATVSCGIMLMVYVVIPVTYDGPQIDRPQFQRSAGIRNGGAAYACVAGAAGAMAAFGCMLYKERNNNQWVISHLFIPIVINSFAGLIATVVIVRTFLQRYWPLTAIITAYVAGGIAGVGLLCFLFFLRRLRNERRLQGAP